ALTWLAARPPGDDASWDPGAATPEGEHLFGALIPAWNDALGRAGGEEDAARLGDEALRVARDADARLAVTLEALVRESGAPDVGERRWYRLVADVNASSRRARLPYYVDPTAVIETAGERPRRWYRVDTYRIEQVHRFHVGRRDFATLH